MGRGRFVQGFVAALAVACGLGACVSQTSTSEEVEPSASAISSPSVPCAARASAVIASTGNVFSNSGSLVDSYQSSLGHYGGTNVGSGGAVEAAQAIVHNGGIIDGTQTPDVAAGSAIVPVPSGATNLPLGSKTPGSLDITTAAETVTLAPGNYVVANLTVASPGAIVVAPAGAVQIWVTGNLNLGGNENLNGVPDNFAILVTSSGSVNVNGSGEFFGFLYAPTSTVSLESTVFGGVVGTTINLNAGSSVHFDQSSVCAAADGGSDAAHDAQLDALPDVSVEASHDATLEANADTGVEAGHDAAADVSVDVAAETGIEAGRDASPDVASDVSVDVAVDTGTAHDASADVSVDVSSDVTTDGAGGGEGVSTRQPTCRPLPIRAAVVLVMEALIAQAVRIPASQTRADPTPEEAHPMAGAQSTARAPVIPVDPVEARTLGALPMPKLTEAPTSMEEATRRWTLPQTHLTVTRAEKLRRSGPRGLL